MGVWFSREKIEKYIKNKRILDVGSGSGGLVKYYKKVTKKIFGEGEILTYHEPDSSSYKNSMENRNEIKNIRPLQSAAAGLSEEQAKEMYRYLAIANYEDRFVIPTGHEEMVLDDAFANQGQDGFSFGNDSSSGVSKITLFPRRRKTTKEPKDLAPSGDNL